MGKLTGRAEPSDTNQHCKSALRPPRGALPVLWSDSSSSEAEALAPVPSGRQQQSRPEARASGPHPVVHRRATCPNPLSPTDLLACTASAARRLTQQLTEQGGWRAAAEALAACTPPPATLLPTPHLTPHLTPNPHLSPQLEYAMDRQDNAMDTTNIDDMFGDSVRSSPVQHSRQQQHVRSGMQGFPSQAAPEPMHDHMQSTSANVQQWQGKLMEGAHAHHGNFVALAHTPITRGASTVTGNAGSIGNTPASVAQPAAAATRAMGQHNAAAAGQSAMHAPGLERSPARTVSLSCMGGSDTVIPMVVHTPSMVVHTSSVVVHGDGRMQSPDQSSSTSSNRSINSHQRPDVGTPTASTAAQHGHSDFAATPAGLPSAPAPTTPATWQSDWQSSLRGGPMPFPSAGSPHYQRASAAPSSHGRTSVSIQQGSNRGLKRPSTVQSSATLAVQGTEPQATGALSQPRTQGRSSGRNTQASRRQAWGLRGCGRESGGEGMCTPSPARSVSQSSPARILQWGVNADTGDDSSIPPAEFEPKQGSDLQPSRQLAVNFNTAAGISSSFPAVPRISEGGMEACESPRSAAASCDPGKVSDDDLTSPESFTYGSRVYASKQGASCSKSQPAFEPQFVAGGGSSSSIRSSSRYSLRRQQRAMLSPGRGLEAVRGSSSSPSPSRLTSRTATASVFTNPVFHTREDILLAGSPAEIKSTAAARRPPALYKIEGVSKLQPPADSPLPSSWTLPQETPRALISSLLGSTTMQQGSHTGAASVNHSGGSARRSRRSSTSSGARRAEMRSSEENGQAGMRDSQGSTGAVLQGMQQHEGDLEGILPGGMITPMLEKVDAAVSRYRRRVHAARHRNNATQHASSGAQGDDGDSGAGGSVSEGSNSGDSYCTATPMNTVQRHRCMVAAGLPGNVADITGTDDENHPVPPLIADGGAEPMVVRSNRSTMSPDAWQTRSTPARLPADAGQMHAAAPGDGSSPGGSDYGDLQHSMRHSMHSTDVTHLIRGLQQARHESTSPRSSIRRLCQAQDCSYQSTARCGAASLESDPTLKDDATSSQPKGMSGHWNHSATQASDADAAARRPTDNGSSWMSSPTSGQLRNAHCNSSPSASAQHTHTGHTGTQQLGLGATSDSFPGAAMHEPASTGQLQSGLNIPVDEQDTVNDSKAAAGVLSSGTQPSISDVDQLDQCLHRGPGLIMAGVDADAALPIDGVALVQASLPHQRPSQQPQQVVTPTEASAGAPTTASPELQQATGPQANIRDLVEDTLPMSLGANLVTGAPDLVPASLATSTRSSGIAGGSTLQDIFSLPLLPALQSADAQLQSHTADSLQLHSLVNAAAHNEPTPVASQQPLAQQGHEQQVSQVQAAVKDTADLGDAPVQGAVIVGQEPGKQPLKADRMNGKEGSETAAAAVASSSSKVNGVAKGHLLTPAGTKRKASKSHQAHNAPQAVSPDKERMYVRVWKAACSTAITTSKVVACLLLALLFGAGLLALQRHGASMLTSKLYAPAPITPAAKLGVHTNVLNTTPAGPATPSSTPTPTPQHDKVVQGKGPICPAEITQLVLLYAVDDPWTQLPSTCYEGVNMAYLAGSISRQTQQLRHSMRRTRAAAAAAAHAQAPQKAQPLPPPAQRMEAGQQRPRASVHDGIRAAQSMRVSSADKHAAADGGSSLSARGKPRARVQVPLPFTHLHPAPPYRPPLRQLFSTYISHDEILRYVSHDEILAYVVRQPPGMQMKAELRLPASKPDAAAAQAPAGASWGDETQHPSQAAAGTAHAHGPADSATEAVGRYNSMQQEQVHPPHDLTGEQSEQHTYLQQQQQVLDQALDSGISAVHPSSMQPAKETKQEGHDHVMVQAVNRSNPAPGAVAAVPQHATARQQGHSAVITILRVLLLAGLLGSVMAGLMLLASYIVSESPSPPGTTTQAMMAAAANVPVMLAAAVCCVAAAAGHGMRAGVFALQQACDGVSERLGCQREPVPFYMQQNTQLLPAAKHMSQAVWQCSCSVLVHTLQPTGQLAVSAWNQASLHLQHVSSLVASSTRSLASRCLSALSSRNAAAYDHHAGSAADLHADGTAAAAVPTDDWQADRALLGLSPLTGRVLRLKGEGLTHTPAKEQEGAHTPADGTEDILASPKTATKHNRSTRKAAAATPGVTPNTRITRSAAAAAAAATGDTQRRNKQSRQRAAQQQQQEMNRDALLQAAAATHEGGTPSVQHVWLRNRVVLRQMVDDE